MRAEPRGPTPEIITIPTSDVAFAQAMERLLQSTDPATPQALELRLRRLFPRAVVRAREISGEPPAWYVYRDGRWRSSLMSVWWELPRLPRIVVNREGWLADANPTALGLLEISADELPTRHFTDFVAPGTMEESVALFSSVDEGHELTVTVLLRPSSGYVLAVDLHAWREDDSLVGVLRLADDVELPAQPDSQPGPSVRCKPETDVAFRGYVELALTRMPEPTTDALALRVRRLYPHAEVTEADGYWLAKREPDPERSAGDWWSDPSLPSVIYDAQGLIVGANDAAVILLGQPLVGHYWQEFVTPGSTEQVSAMLAILAEVGRAESRFRMPRADGSLVEFDSYTEVAEESFTTVMRPRG